MMEMKLVMQFFNLLLDGLIYLENLAGDTRLNFDVENQLAMTMHDGNVGIGTNDPTAKLHLGGASPSLKIGSGSSGDGGNIEWRTTDDRHWNIDQYGDSLRIFTEDSNDQNPGSTGIKMFDNGDACIGNCI